MDRSLDQESSARTQEPALAALHAKADHGDADAQFSLGFHYSGAVGVELDFAQAAQWYRKAADQDYALAQYNLGVMFARGQGVPQDDATAAGWLRKAAEGGDAAGQYNLGVRCHRASVDTLCPDAMESRIEAYKWLQLAAAQGYGDSFIASQRVTLDMTRAAVVEADRRAAAFVIRTPVTPPTP